MSDTITTDATQRTRNGSVILTDRHCEKRVDRRVKIYDRKCAGLYVSVIPSGVATFNFKFTDRATGKQRSKWLGVYNPDYTVDNARTAVYALKNRIGNGENIAETLRQQKAQRARQGRTVDEIIEERIEWMQVPVRKADGEMRPRIESWKNVARHLRNFVSPRLGKKLASEVTKHDIATLSNDIVAGKHGGKASVSNARHMRRAASGLFNWAAEAGRDYVTASPCVNLPKLDEEHPRDRVLTEDEIRTLWHGLDRSDLPWDRTTRLAIKFALVTMLRSGEMLPIHRDELNTENGTVDIPARRVKKRRVINQPLSDLALEIINEAMGNYEYAFTGRFGDAPLARQAMSGALTGTKVTKNGKRVTRTPGICELLGLAPFTPHDLRRTAATMCGELGLSESAIALCLDHQANKDENGKPLPAGHQPGLQSRCPHPGRAEARGSGGVGCRASADHRRARNRASSRLKRPNCRKTRSHFGAGFCLPPRTRWGREPASTARSGPAIGLQMAVCGSWVRPAMAYGVAANVLNLLPLSAAKRTWPDLPLGRPCSD